MTVQAKGDYYQILGIDRTASQMEIVDAHQRLIAEIRKSDEPTAIDQLLAANRARTVLADPVKRKIYDRLGLVSVEDSSPSYKDFDDQGLDPNDEYSRNEKVVNWIGIILDLFL